MNAERLHHMTDMITIFNMLHVKITIKVYRAEFVLVPPQTLVATVQCLVYDVCPELQIDEAGVRTQDPCVCTMKQLSHSMMPALHVSDALAHL